MWSGFHGGGCWLAQAVRQPSAGSISPSSDGSLDYCSISSVCVLRLTCTYTNLVVGLVNELVARIWRGHSAVRFILSGLCCAGSSNVTKLLSVSSVAVQMLSDAHTCTHLLDDCITHAVGPLFTGLAHTMRQDASEHRETGGRLLLLMGTRGDRGNCKQAHRDIRCVAQGILELSYVH